MRETNAEAHLQQCRMPSDKASAYFFFWGGGFVEEHMNKLTGLHSNGAGNTASACGTDTHVGDM